MITLQEIKKNRDIVTLVNGANQSLAVLGYTEHGLRHAGFVSKTSANILQCLGYSERMVELAAITGWVHDVGNAVNRHNHGITGASLLFPILVNLGMPMEEICLIVSAVGNHEEQNGAPVNEISAALIIADKSDAHRTRVRRKNFDPGDIHDAVNYAISRSYVEVDKESKNICFIVEMDETSSIMDFLQIYLTRMRMTQKAAQHLGCSFDLSFNGVVLNTKAVLS